MRDEEIIRELKSVEEQYRNKPVPTFEVNISSMARSCRQHIEQLAKENAELEAEIKRLTALIEKMKCCENSTTTLSGEFISCSLQEEKAALQEAVDKLEAKNKEMHDKITDIIECFISVSSKDDIELSGAAMEIAEILDIKLFR